MPSVDQRLALFALSSALLWVMLVPRWDGFDEAQHFSYIQSVRSGAGFPVLGRTCFTPEVWQSFCNSPASPEVQKNYPMLRTFDEARLGLRAARPPSPPPNYEAQQAPLAYLLLAPFEWLLSAVPIEPRLRILRFALLVCAMVLFWRIAATPTAFFMVISTEMFLACCGHVANDAIAIPLFAWLFFESERRSRTAVWLLCAGLLTKASFLAVLPVVAWRLRRRWRLMLLAGLLPACWYARNAWLYGNISGMQQQLTSLPLADLLRAARQIPWTASLGETYRGALWLGNNSLLQWSVWQVNLAMAALIGAAFLALRNDRPRRNWLLLFAGAHCAGVAYAAVQTFAYTGGSGVAASPWYATSVWLLLLVVIFSGDPPRWLPSTLVATWTYWFAATFWFRLIPWYAGVQDGPATAANLIRWYSTSFSQVQREIGGGVLALAAIVTLLAVATAWSLLREAPCDIMRGYAVTPSPHRAVPGFHPRC